MVGSRPEIRVMSVSCPVNAARGKISEGIFSYVSLYHAFQFNIKKFRVFLKDYNIFF